MHEYPADRVRADAAGFVAFAIHILGNADRVRSLPLEGEFGRVVQHKDATVRRSGATLRRVEVTSENVRLIDPTIGQKTICRLGVRLSWQAKGMLSPTAPPICPSNLRSRLVRRSSARLQAASSPSSQSVSFSSIAPLPNRCRTRNHTRFAPCKRGTLRQLWAIESG